MRIALIGTRGVPARYGGFETCVEEVGARLAGAGHEVTVYCRSSRTGADARLESYRGMDLVHLPAVPQRHVETLSHTGLSVGHVLRRSTDAAIVFNAANSPMLPLLRARGIPVATHVDGLEWKRAKWGGGGRRYYRAAESLAVRWSDALIADAAGIADYYTTEFGVDTELIRYGAPIVEAGDPAVLEAVDLAPGSYHLAVARFEPENHVDIIVEGYSKSSADAPLVVVGAAPYADAYTRRVHDAADDRVRFLGAVWDQDLLDQLYANCITYQHGHSVGGTNPSLLRAIGAGAATDAFDVGFNREVLGSCGRYWSTPDDIAPLFESAEADTDTIAARGSASRTRAGDYDWDDVAREYESLCEGLRDGSLRRSGASGRRVSASADLTLATVR
ncbi:MAG: DUF1972 domain-containing protein [Acidimicrobiales bacterium]|nr:DUF1972 domain-containing protein [Acidimicrobiales bacterium]